LLLSVSGESLSQTTMPTGAHLRESLDAIQKQLPDFKRQLDALRNRGADVAYPLVTYTVLENFTGYAQDDLEHSVPDGWGMIGINGCKVTYEPVQDAHGGDWAARIVNKTPQTPNVYGKFEATSGATLKEGKTYTLSAWIKSDDPGSLTIPINPSWSDRLALPASKGAWQRVSKTFSPAKADLGFGPVVLSEGVGSAVIDDICLVEGAEPEVGKNLIPNSGFELTWNAKRVARELPDMQQMAAKLSRLLQQAVAGTITLPQVPRWNGTQRPTIVGPSFIGANGKPILFVGYGHFDQVRADIEKFPGYGINIVQHGEFGPAQLFPEENKIDDTPLNNLIDELDRAAKAGVAVDFLISPHYFPQWIFDKHPHLRKPRGDFFPWSIYAPEGRALVKKFVDYVLPKIKDKPALLSICLSNEPINAQDPDEFSVVAWRDWLKKRHGDVATLNQRWGASYKSIDEIPQPSSLSKTPEPRPGPAWCDFVRWNQEYFADFHKALADMVKEVAPNLPVHIKATTWHAYRSESIHSGDDPTLFGGVSDINGNDSVNLWSFGKREGDLIERGTKDFAQGWRENALGYTLQRSTHDAPVFNSENHLIFDREARYVSPEHIRSALWMGAIHGQSATTLWVWQREKENPSGDLAGSIMERASCAEAVGVVNHDLNRAAEEITAIQNAKADVLILQSNTSAVWDGQKYDQELLKTFTALSFTGLKIGFVTERQLEQGKPVEGKILFIPNCVHLSDAAVKTLAGFHGAIVMHGQDGLTRNEYGQPRKPQVNATVHAQGVAWQDTFASITRSLHDAKIEPAVKVRDEKGNVQKAVQWQTGKLHDATIVNLYNASHDPQTVKLSAAGKDVLTGQSISAEQAITLQPLEVRLVRCE
jgi:hypothetical protein